MGYHSLVNINKWFIILIHVTINLLLVGLDSYLLSKTARFAQRELLRWAKYQHLMVVWVLEFQ
jgi:hypothetical protein